MQLITGLSKKSLVILSILTLSGAGLRLYTLGYQGLGVDEMYTLRFASGLETHSGKQYEGEIIDVKGFRDHVENELRFLQPLTVIEGTYDYEPSHPPLYYLLVNLSLVVFGNSEFALRFPSAVFGALTIPFIFVLGRRLYNWETGLIAAAIFAFAPSQIYYGQMARMYSMVCFLAVVSMWLLVELSFRREEGGAWSSWGLWAGWAGVTATGLYTHYFFAFIPAIQFLFVGVRHFRDRIFLLRWFAAAGLALLPFLPWLVVRIFHHSLRGVAWLKGESEFSSLITSAANGVVGFVWSDEQRPYKAVWFWIALLVIGILARRRRTGLWLLPIWMVIPPALVVAIDILLVTQASSISQYYIVAAPALYLLLACGILTIRPHLLSKLVAGLGFVYLVLGGYWTAEGKIRAKPEFKEAGLEITRTSRSDDAVIVFSEMPTNVVMLLSYYMDRQEKIGRVFVHNVTEVDLNPVLKQMEAHDQVTLVLAYVQRATSFDPQSVTRVVPDLEFVGSHKYRDWTYVFRYKRNPRAGVPKSDPASVRSDGR